MEHCCSFLVAKEFRLSQKEAKTIIKEVIQSVVQWRDVAKNFGLEKQEIDRMASAFELAYTAVKY